MRGPDECWPWTGAVTGKGYGKISLAYRHRNAHRVAFELWHGPIPDGLLVCHRCDNRPCCNPAHLFVGTAKDNAEDMMAKGRWKRPPATVVLSSACPNGHPYVDGSWARAKEGHRTCRVCQRDAKRRWRARKRAQIDPGAPLP